MKLVTEITIKMVEEIPEHEESVMRMTFESGDMMEIARVQMVEEMVEHLSLKDPDDVYVSYNLLDDEEEEEDDRDDE